MTNYNIVILLNQYMKYNDLIDNTFISHKLMKSNIKKNWLNIIKKKHRSHQMLQNKKIGFHLKKKGRLCFRFPNFFIFMVLVLKLYKYWSMFPNFFHYN